MSTDCTLLNPVTREECTVPYITGINGGTQIMGGTNKLWLNVTGNYMKIIREAMNDSRGLKALEGMTAFDSAPILMMAANQLTGEPDEDYWKATEGNARKALVGLLHLAMIAPKEAIWEICS